MTYKVKLEEAKTRLADLVEVVAKGKEVIILVDEHPVARLVPFKSSKRNPRFGSAKGLVEMSEDFDAPVVEA